MKQKLALISALMRKPRLLILDEPFVGLDPQAAFVMKGYLRRVCDEGGSVLFSTHVLEVAQSCATALPIIKRADAFVEEGPTADIVGKSIWKPYFLNWRGKVKAMRKLWCLVKWISALCWQR